MPGFGAIVVPQSTSGDLPVMVAASGEAANSPLPCQCSNSMKRKTRNAYSCGEGVSVLTTPLACRGSA